MGKKPSAKKKVLEQTMEVLNQELYSLHQVQMLVDKRMQKSLLENNLGILHFLAGYGHYAEATKLMLVCKKWCKWVAESEDFWRAFIVDDESAPKKAKAKKPHSLTAISDQPSSQPSMVKTGFE